MAKKFLGVPQDLDLRRSLNPLSGDLQLDHRFTKFIRHRDTLANKSNISDLQVDTRINFNPNKQVQKSTFNQILQRYHDPSLAVKKRRLGFKEKFLQYWCKFIKWILCEYDEQKIFRKDSSWLLLWNFLVIYAYILNIYQIPIAIFFTSEVYRDEFNTFGGLFLNWLAIAIIFINIVLVRPNTEFQNLGYLISKRKQIIEGYFGIKFFLDMLALLILLIYCLAEYDRLVYLKLIFYFDIGTLFTIDEMIIDKIQLKPFAFATYKLTRLMGFMLFILIWLSSIFFFIDYNYYLNKQQTDQYNWLTYSMCAFHVIDGQSYGTDLITTYPNAWYIWLNYAVYWSLQTISTVGYGDITPRNPVSVVFTNISILIMMFFFVFFINSVIQLIDQMTSAQQKQKAKNIKKFKLYQMNAKAKLKEIGLKYSYIQETMTRNQRALENTSNNIRSYLYDMDITNLLQQEENVENLVNQSLTPELRQQLFINYRQMFFKKVLVFGQIAKISNDFMQIYEKLIYKIKEVSYAENQVIYARGQRQSNHLYYLLKGRVLLQYPNSRYEKTIEYQPTQQSNEQSCNNNDRNYFNFGVRQFFTREQRDHHTITQTYCKIQFMQYEDFISTIKEQKSFYYKFCDLRDTIQIQKVNMLTGQECYECNSKKHHLFTCEACLFNLRIHIKEEWQDQYKIQINTPVPAVNSRVPFYYRDKNYTQKINPKNQIVRRRSMPQDKILMSKFYKFQQNTLKFNEK